MRRSQALGLAVVAGAAFSVSGCEKPPPAVSVFSGPASVHTEAACWAFDTDALAPGECAQDILQGSVEEGVPALTVQPGNTLGISVDEAVADAGWTIVWNGQTKVTQEPLTTSYFRFTLPLDLGADRVPVQVVAGREANVRGVWLVNLQPEQ